jgi:hypothetical protein
MTITLLRPVVEQPAIAQNRPTLSPTLPEENFLHGQGQLTPVHEETMPAPSDPLTEWLLQIEAPKPTTPVTTEAPVAKAARRLLEALASPTVTEALIVVFRAILGTRTAEPPVELSPDLAAFKDLVRWLRSTDEEIAAMIGVGRTTAYAWQREGRSPRPRTARALHQAHALAAALVQRLGEQGAIHWLCDADPGRREHFLHGDIDAVQREAHGLLFAPVRRRPRPGSWIPESVDAEFA